METKPQAGKTRFAFRAFDKLTLALGLDHSLLALIPSPTEAGWRGQEPCCGHKAKAGPENTLADETGTHDVLPTESARHSWLPSRDARGKVIFLGYWWSEPTGLCLSFLPSFLPSFFLSDFYFLSAFLGCVTGALQLPSCGCERAIGRPHPSRKSCRHPREREKESWIVNYLSAENAGSGFFLSSSEEGQMCCRPSARDTLW